MMTTPLFRRALALVAGGTAAAAFAGLPTVIFSNIAASPTSDVPGLAGVKFHTGNNSQFDRPYGSPDGNRWILGAITNQVVAMDEIVVIGSGTTGAGASVVHEGDPTFFDGALTYGLLDTQMGINDAGGYAFSIDTSAATGVDEIAARWTLGGGFELVAREGTQAIGQGAGIGYGSTDDGTQILNDASEAAIFRSAALTGATTQQVIYKNVSVSSGSVLVQTDVSIPAGQLVAPNQTVDNISAGRSRADATGAHVIYHGNLNGPTTTDLFIAFDDAVVAQEGAPLPGGYFPGFNVAILSADAGSQQISANNGHYAYRGNINDGTGATATDFVILDGTLVAATDQPIRSENAELYVDSTTFTTTFFNNCVNSCGDIVIGGTTDAADANANAVLVLNGKILVARENDPVDLDGDGTADAGVALHVFNNDDSFLTDDRKYYFHCDLRDPANPTTFIGQALLWIQLPQLADMNCDMVIDFFDIDPFLLALFDAPAYDVAFPDCDIRNADVDKSGNVDFFDIDAFLDALFAP